MVISLMNGINICGNSWEQSMWYMQAMALEDSRTRTISLTCMWNLFLFRCLCQILPSLQTSWLDLPSIIETLSPQKQELTCIIHYCNHQFPALVVYIYFNCIWRWLSSSLNSVDAVKPLKIYLQYLVPLIGWGLLKPITVSFTWGW